MCIRLQLTSGRATSRKQKTSTVLRTYILVCWETVALMCGARISIYSYFTHEVFTPLIFWLKWLMSCTWERKSHPLIFFISWFYQSAMVYRIQSYFVMKLFTLFGVSNKIPSSKKKFFFSLYFPGWRPTTLRWIDMKQFQSKVGVWSCNYSWPIH